MEVDEAFQHGWVSKAAAEKGLKADVPTAAEVEPRGAPNGRKPPDKPGKGGEKAPSMPTLRAD